jgi:hypothetical protein
MSYGVNEISFLYSDGGTAGPGSGYQMFFSGIQFLTADSDWNNLTFGTGYEDGSFGALAGYRKIGSVVYLRGVIAKTSGNIEANDTPIGTLPSGYRPTAVQYFCCRSNGGNVITLQINSDGTSSVGIGSYSSGTYIALDGISYTID